MSVASRGMMLCLAVLLACAPLGFAQSTAQYVVRATSPVRVTAIIQPSIPLLGQNDYDFFLVNPGDGLDCSYLKSDCGGIYTFNGLADSTDTTPKAQFQFGQANPNLLGGTLEVYGGSPDRVIEDPNGFFLGTTLSFGPGGMDVCLPWVSTVAGCGVLFEGNLGVDNNLHKVMPVLLSFSLANEDQGGPIILGSDGNYYLVTYPYNPLGFPNAVLGVPPAIDQITPQGQITRHSTFGNIPLKFGPETHISPTQIVEGDDGNFYGVVTPGYVFVMNPSGDINVLTSFPQFLQTTSDMGGEPYGQLVEGPDGAFYGVSGYPTLTPCDNDYGTEACGMVYRVTKDGSFTVLHAFTDSDGYGPASGLLLGSDGVLYGTTYYGGDTTKCPSGGYEFEHLPSGCGTLFSITTSGTFTVLHAFEGGADGAHPEGLIQDSIGAPGTIWGTAQSDGQAGSPASVIFQVTLPAGHQAAPVQMQLFRQSDMSPLQAGDTIDNGTPVVVKWTVLNAFSNTMRQCYAHSWITGNSNYETAGGWTGKQTGTPGPSGYSGQATVTPVGQPLPGNDTFSYVFGLSCGGVEGTNTYLMVKKDNLKITTAAMPDANVGQNYSVAIVSAAGTGPYTWSVISGALPPGLSLDGPSGTISGTPKQFGNYSFTVQVKDSSSTPQTATANLTMTVKTGLVVNPALLPSAKINVPYSQSITVTGGVQPYTMVVSTGALPDGLTLNSTSGVLSGTPTKPGNYNFTLTVTDAENPQATANQTYALKVASEVLTVDATALPQGAVGENYYQSRAITGGIGPYNGTVASGVMPKGVGLEVEGNTLTIGGQPQQYGAGAPFTVQITDSDTPPQVANVTYTIPVQSTLKITTPSTLEAATLGEPYFYMVNATGGVPPYKWTAGGGLNNFGLSFDGTNGYFHGTPTVSGSFIGGLAVTDSEDNPASYSENVTINIAGTQTAALTSTALTATTTAAVVGQSVTLTAKVNVQAGTPLGIITFASGSNVLGTASLTNGVATLTTSFSAAGVYNVIASYPGDDADQASASTPVAITVVAPTVSASFTPGSITIQPGQSGTMTISITPSNGYTGTVNFSCGSLPAHISCTFAPPSLTIAAGAGLVTDMLTIHTSAQAEALAVPPSQNRRRQTPQSALAMIFGLPGLFGMMAFSKKDRGRRIRRLICLAILAGSGMAGLAALTGCGAGNSSTSARPGAYTIPVTLTLAGGATQTVNASVVVR